MFLLTISLGACSWSLATPLRERKYAPSSEVMKLQWLSTPLSGSTLRFSKVVGLMMVKIRLRLPTMRLLGSAHRAVISSPSPRPRVTHETAGQLGTAG